jgi:hypothetical protein
MIPEVLSDFGLRGPLPPPPVTSVEDTASSVASVEDVDEILDDFGHSPLPLPPVFMIQEVLHDYGMRDPVSPDPVTISPSPVSIFPSPIYVSPSPVPSVEEVLDDFGLHDPVSPDPEVLEDYGMRDPVPLGQVSMDSEVLDDFGLRDPVSPDPSDDLGAGATASPDTGLLEEGPSQIGTRQPTQAIGHFGSSAKVRCKFCIAGCHMHFTLSRTAWKFEDPPPSSKKMIEKSRPSAAQGRNRGHKLVCSAVCM